jgi:hypothetical protein
MIWQFRLIDSNNISTIVEEPVGWDGISCSFTRNMSHHGIFSNINTSDFEWVDTAYDLLLAEYNAQGANGNYQLLIEYECADGDGYTTYFQGKFDFNTLERQCLDYCFIKCSVTTTRCADIFLSRMGQDVDIQATTNFDGETITPPIPRVLNIEGQDVLLQNKAFNDGTTVGFSFYPFGANGYLYLNFCMTLPARNMEEIGNFNMNGATLIPTTSGAFPPLSEFIFDHTAAFENFGQFLTIWQRTSDPLNCIDNDATIDIICKGTFNVEYTTDPPGGQYDGTVIPILKLSKYNSTDGTFTEITNVGFIPSITCPTGVVQSVPFNFTYSNTPSYAEADYLFLYWECFFEPFAWNVGDVRKLNISINYDNTSKVEMTLNSNCAPTTATSYYLPEVLKFLPKAYMDRDCPSVVMETELNQCLDYYQITKGSLIRNVTEPSIPRLFTNYEFMFDQCRKIFNIGWGFNNNDTELSIANIEDFYQSTIIADVGLLNKATFTTAKDLVYGTITIGYNKWEAEEYNGLDEMNTERQYRRNINSNPSELDLMSDIITAGYTIEVTRRKNQANTGTSDWRYDDDIFLINTFVDEGSLYAYRGASDTANMYSPSTRMNLRLTPVRNLMRWFKTLAGAQPTITNETLKFTSGTGNYLAESRFADQCFIETGVVSEQQNIISTDVVAPTPIWKTIYATFDAPLTMVQFEAIKTNVYGAIRFRCGNDLYLGNIVTLSHEPNTGLASFKLLLRR